MDKIINFFKRKKLPIEGRRVRITWLPKNNGEKNAYIGMEGVVKDVNKLTGSFNLFTGTSWLILGDNKYKFVYIDNFDQPDFGIVDPESIKIDIEDLKKCGWEYAKKWIEELREEKTQWANAYRNLKKKIEEK